MFISLVLSVNSSNKSWGYRNIEHLIFIFYFLKRPSPINIEHLIKSIINTILEILLFFFFYQKVNIILMGPTG